MSKHLGDYDASAVIYGKFTTYRPSTGASFTLGGTPALSVYKDNSVTQSTTGVTLTADFDSVTGLNHFAIDTSADGTFYSAGSFFDIVITTGTVDSVSVTGSVVASFTIRKDSSLKPTTAARTLDVSAGGEAGVDWANVGSPTTAVNLSATNIDVDQVVASVSGAVGSVTGAVGSVTGAVGSVTGAVGSVTGNVGGNVTGSVGSVTGLTNATIADAVWDEDATAHQTQGTFGQAIGDPGADTDTIFGLVNTNLDAAVSTRLSSAGYTAPDNASIAAILTDTAEIGVAGAGLTALASAANLATVAGYIDTEIATLQTSVNDLPTNAELATALDALPTAAENATAVLTTAMTESYRADGATGTLAQVQYEILAHLGESSIVSTTKTIKKVDGTTTAATFTLDSDTAPTSITRAT